MSYKSFMPVKKADQVAWAANFVAVVKPAAADYGVPESMMTAFDTINTNLQAAWTVTDTEATRTKVTIIQRDNLLKQMKALAGKMVSIIQGTPGVTDDMLASAKLTVRSTARTKPDMPLQPVVGVTRINGRDAFIEIMKAQGSRGKPARVESATIMIATGDTCPMSMDGFSYYTTTGDTKVTLSFPPSDTGTTVWVTAFWTNTAKVSGPSCTPIPVQLPAGGNYQPVNTQKPAPMRVAA
ncbi:MAG: hypothetical protein ACTHM6_12280 [Tepidisphaeraceae bacterium]